MQYWVTKETKPLYLSDVINVLQKNEFDVQEWDFKVLDAEHVEIDAGKYLPLKGKEKHCFNTAMFFDYFLATEFDPKKTVHATNYEVRNAIVNVTSWAFANTFRKSIEGSIIFGAYKSDKSFEYPARPGYGCEVIDQTFMLDSPTIGPFVRELTNVEILDLALKIHIFFRQFAYDFNNDPKTAEIIKTCSTFKRDSEEMNNYVKAQVDKIEKQMLIKYQKMINDFRWQE